jgi:arylsulfatase
LGRNILTIAEALGLCGYKNYMSGKWHVTRHTRPEGPQDNWPRQRGFDRFYGTITGAGSFYDPATLCRDNTYITPLNDAGYQPETYYYTDAISDNAVTFLRDHAQESAEKPFFLYLAYTTAHWPMHALPGDIKKYKGKYDDGFEPVRQARLKKLKSLGLVSAETKLSPGSDNWEKTTHKEWEIRNMETYAAMVDSMDQGIGQVMNELREQGRFKDTLFLYLQDNGGCAEGYGRYAPKKVRTNCREKFGLRCRPGTGVHFVQARGRWQGPRILLSDTGGDGPMFPTLRFENISILLMREGFPPR